jgi:Protein of unknown function (DUF1236)
MRKFLLASAAVTALVAGPAIANAQGAPKSQDTPAASSQQAPKGGAREDMDKKGGPSAQSGERRDTGSAGSDQPASKSKGSQSTQDMQREDRSKAGQKSGPSESGRATTGTSQGAQEQQDRSKAQKSGESDMQKQKSGTSESQKQKSGASDSQKQKSGASDMQKGTTGAAQGTQGAQPGDQKPGSQPKASSTPSDQRSTTGQSQSDQRMKGDRAKRDNQPAGRQGETQTDQRTGTSGTADQRNQAGSASSSTSTTTTANPEVQSKFSQTIEKQNVRSVDKVNFSVAVGSTVPTSVRFHDVPRDIVTIHPEFRGKKFILVRDEIVIIEPRTHKIVSVIPRSGRATTGTATSVRQTTSSKLQLSPEKKRKIHDIVMRERVSPVREDIRVSVGEDVPRSLQFHTFSEEIVTEVPEIRSYRFFVKGNDVVLVDPGEHRIVEVID